MSRSPRLLADEAELEVEPEVALEAVEALEAALVAEEVLEEVSEVLPEADEEALAALPEVDEVDLEVAEVVAVVDSAVAEVAEEATKLCCSASISHLHKAQFVCSYSFESSQTGSIACTLYFIDCIIPSKSFT